MLCKVILFLQEIRDNFLSPNNCSVKKKRALLKWKDRNELLLFDTYLLLIVLVKLRIEFSLFRMPFLMDLLEPGWMSSNMGQ